ncbi:hypothetical protein C9374_001352 [Naegleria lovaniensis]|uniref:Uncharacterized protein n=1 Tax=Naegleria lovaniensis TaxID=51637 RepID=A0AA88KMN5_NAELO|nr:uncharacterized protein C9374_001352 [Naegleria lovaniensis]KAG2387758.1 hypothetical protein C9374_001352 [Naegleria lovaniensis]
MANIHPLPEIHNMMQDASNKTNATSFVPHPLTPMELYHILNFSTTAPYIPIELILVVLSVVVYVYKFKEMKRNQHVLFVMLFILQADVILDLALRIHNEASGYELNRTTDGKQNYLTTGVAVAHRCVINFLVLWQLWIMYFLCSVFLQICRDTMAISSIGYKCFKFANIATIVIINIFFVSHTLYNIIMGAINLQGVLIDFAVYIPLEIALLVAAGVLFFSSTLVFSILLNIISYKLESSLSKSMVKLKQMMKGNEEFVSREQAATLHFKQTTLRKTRLMHAGLSIAILMESFGFLCISFYVINVFFGFVYLTLANFGILIFVSLLIGINAPMKEVQQFFQKYVIDKGSVDATNKDRNSTQVPAVDVKNIC